VDKTWRGLHALMHHETAGVYDLASVEAAVAAGAAGGGGGGAGAGMPQLHGLAMATGRG